MNHQHLIPQVLQWLEQLRLNNEPYGAYRMSRSTEATLFSSCFALFIRKLCNDLDTITNDQRKEWSELIKSSQDEKTGLFICPELKNNNKWSENLTSHHDWGYVAWQSTTFCLSALEALNDKPRFPFKFLEKWNSEETIIKFLEKLDWNKRVWTAGNIAMFLGIALICNQEMCGNDNSSFINCFFDWHDKFQDSKSGFWCTENTPTLLALFGAMHQFLLYYYTERSLKYKRKIIDNTLRFQEKDGHFFPCGGGVCEDYDAANTLVNMYKKIDYRQKDIENSLRLLFKAVLKTRGNDGGFLWVNRKNYIIKDWCDQVFSFQRYRHLKDWKMALRRTTGTQLRRIKKQGRLPSGWIDTPIPLHESDLFATWLRLLVIAEVSQIIQTPFSKINWNFLKTPGLGWSSS